MHGDMAKIFSPRCRRRGGSAEAYRVTGRYGRGGHRGEGKPAARTLQDQLAFTCLCKSANNTVRPLEHFRQKSRRAAILGYGKQRFIQYTLISS